MSTRRVLAAFVGHGHEHPGMAARLIAEDPSARAWVKLAGDAAGFDALASLARGGPSFHDTRVVQPLLTAVSLAVFDRLVRVGVKFDLALGHSLGEIAAWSAADGLDPDAAIVLAAKRGAIAGPVTDTHLAQGGGLVVLECSAAELAVTLAKATSAGQAGLAVDDGDDRWVVWADGEAMRAIRRSLGLAPLAAMGPWHGPLMADGFEAYRDCVREAEAHHGLPRRGPTLVLNQDGKAAPPSAPIADLIASQFVEPVRFADCVRTTVAEGITDIVGIGPAKGLRRTFARNGSTARFWLADDLDSVKTIGRALGEG